MTCPHCLVAFHDNPVWISLGPDKDGNSAVKRVACPACKRMVLWLCRGTPVMGQRGALAGLRDITFVTMFWPKGSGRPPCPHEVKAESPDVAADYEESSLVLPDSAKASAALSRRCLQSILREKAKTKSKDLYDQIQEVLDGGTLPSHIADSLDAVRVIGNFAAHPIKSQTTGVIVDVEPGEAEWNLEAVEGLFDFFYVQPAKTAARKAALNKKLADTGKPQIE